MRIRILGLALLFSSNTFAASDWRVFIEVETGYKVIEKYSESYDNCKIPFSFSGGIQHRSSLSFGVKHLSNLDCGRPLNGKEEYYTDYLFIKYKFGGF